MIFFVTGAKGFLGRHLSRLCAAKAHSVYGIGHGEWSDSAAWGIKHWYAAEVDGDSLKAVSSEVGVPDAIFHLAGGSSVGPSFMYPEADFKKTVMSSVAICEWTRSFAPGAKLIFASSAAVYGASHPSKIKESDSLSPFSPYGFHKRMAELIFESYAKSFGLNVAIIRLFSVYGEDLKKQLLWDLCSKIRSSNSSVMLGGTGAELRDWLHVSDACDLLLRLFEFASDKCLVINGGTGVPTSIRDVAEIIGDVWGGGVDVAFSGVSRVGDPASLVASTELLNRLEFIHSINIQDGLRDYVKWFKEHEGSL